MAMAMAKEIVILDDDEEELQPNTPGQQQQHTTVLTDNQRLRILRQKELALARRRGSMQHHKTPLSTPTSAAHSCSSQPTDLTRSPFSDIHGPDDGVAADVVENSNIFAAYRHEITHAGQFRGGNGLVSNRTAGFGVSQSDVSAWGLDFREHAGLEKKNQTLTEKNSTLTDGLDADGLASHRVAGSGVSQSDVSAQSVDLHGRSGLGQKNQTLTEKYLTQAEGLEADGWRSVRKQPTLGSSFGRGMTENRSTVVDYIVVEESPETVSSQPKKSRSRVRVEETSDCSFAERDSESEIITSCQSGVTEPGKTSGMRMKQDGRITLSLQQLQVLKAIAKGKSVFVTGSAGTGKSFLLEFAIRVLNRIHGADSVFVTASTGLAACAIGGTTLHSFSGVGLGIGTKEVLVAKVLSRRELKKRWIKARALVIDEISMIDGEFLDKLDFVGSRVRSSYGKNRPFGGLQLVVTGDFFQLPPVNPENVNKYFAFEADCWSRCFDLQVELTHVFRQSDQDFVALLNEVRRGLCSYQTLGKLQGCTKPVACQGIIPTRLYPHKVDVSRENDQNLRGLGREIVNFNAKDEGKSEFAIRQLENVRAQKLLSLCVGAQVMLVKNLDTDIGLVNGARGVVVKFISEEDNSSQVPKDVMLTVSPHGTLPVVRFACDGLERVVRPESWSVLDGNIEVAKRTQVPLILAWALSVHKCQGMTLDRVETDLSKAFDYGMVYVALSRVRSLDGLQLMGFDPSRIKIHPKVISFYEKLGE